MDEITSDTLAAPKIALGSIDGPPEIVASLRNNLVRQYAADPVRAGRWVDTSMPPDSSPFRSASSRINVSTPPITDDTSEISDFEWVERARRGGATHVLRGEVMANRGRVAIDRKPIQMAWRLIPIDSDAIANRDDSPKTPSKRDGEVFRIDPVTVAKRHPDLFGGAIDYVDPDLPSNREKMMVAAARETLALVSPSIDRQTVTIIRPKGMPGDRDVRRGNTMAKSGRWGAAAEIYAAVLRRHPRHHVAMHNAAIAKVAAQDFASAEDLIDRAIRRRRSSRYAQTQAWIRMRRSDYERSMATAGP